MSLQLRQLSTCKKKMPPVAKEALAVSLCSGGSSRWLGPALPLVNPSALFLLVKVPDAPHQVPAASA